MIIDCMFNVFTKDVHKPKQYTNLMLHKENYTSFVVSFLHPQNGGRGVLIQNFGR